MMILGMYVCAVGMVIWFDLSRMLDSQFNFYICISLCGSNLDPCGWNAVVLGLGSVEVVPVYSCSSVYSYSSVVLFDLLLQDLLYLISIDLGFVNYFLWCPVVLFIFMFCFFLLGGFGFDRIPDLIISFKLSFILFLVLVQFRYSLFLFWVGY